MIGTPLWRYTWPRNSRKTPRIATGARGNPFGGYGVMGQASGSGQCRVARSERIDAHVVNCTVSYGLATKNIDPNSN